MTVHYRVDREYDGVTNITVDNSGKATLWRGPAKLVESIKMSDIIAVKDHTYEPLTGEEVDALLACMDKQV